MKQQNDLKGRKTVFIKIVGILLGVVCLFSGCKKEEAVFVTDTDRETADEMIPMEESTEEPKEKTEAGGEAEVALKMLTVYVCGQVYQPGVYELEAGSRIVDAVEAAGGMTEEAARDGVNLALPLEDAQMIRVPSVEEVKTSLDAEGVYTGGLSDGVHTGVDEQGRVSLNFASKEQLMTLPGIGEAKAEAILAYRQRYGGFDSLEELMQIPGIKGGVFRKIQEKITLS